MNIKVDIGNLDAVEVPFDAGMADAGMAQEASGGETVVAVVKWFRADKGYGFLDTGDGLGDAFLHAKALRSYGLEMVATGATIRAVIEQGPRGRQVTSVLDVDVSTSPVPSRPARPKPTAPQRQPRDLALATELTGKVKWFDDVRGFGFVAGDDFGRDVFVHCSTLRSARVARLVGGEAVTMRVIETDKGREAVDISL